MTEAEAKRVQEELKLAYGLWHQCGLPTKEAKQMKLKPGRLCDCCMEDIAASMKRIVLGEGDGR